ncbi:hypothetical protein FB384_002035 [Prauserella sediminis]|uniref:Uncharacterized protein n=1 Tax=Prauserella sediminis TaxID=577680 RepID=A0A839XK50_9PSEU|nr:hypothetical protein [Prauserella sediminis]
MSADEPVGSWGMAVGKSVPSCADRAYGHAMPRDQGKIRGALTRRPDQRPSRARRRVAVINAPKVPLGASPWLPHDHATAADVRG